MPVRKTLKGKRGGKKGPWGIYGGVEEKNRSSVKRGEQFTAFPRGVGRTEEEGRGKEKERRGVLARRDSGAESALSSGNRKKATLCILQFSGF